MYSVNIIFYRDQISHSCNRVGTAIVLLYCIVLMGWSLMPNAMQPFQNLGITRMRICRLKFAQRPIVTGLRFFNDPQLKIPTRGLVLRMFTFRKNPSTLAGFEPANLGSRGEHVTPRPSRPISYYTIVFVSFLVLLFFNTHCNSAAYVLYRNYK